MPLVFIAVMLISVGCDDEVLFEEEIRHAEVIAEEQPERALAIMEAVDGQAISGASNRAYYALVYSEVCYYNRMLVDCDSLTRVAVDYYKTSNDYEKRARAYYQHGMVQHLAGNAPQAIISFTAAHDALDNAISLHETSLSAHETSLSARETSLSAYETSLSARLDGLIHRTMGDIYRANFLYRNSLNSYEEALECFNRLDLPYHSHYTLYNMGQAAIKLGEYDYAEELFITARDYAIATNDKNFLCAVLHEMCEIYLQREEYTKCGEAVAMFEEYDCVLWFISRYYAIKAIVTSEQGDNDSALRYIALAEESSGYDEAAIESAKYHVYNNIGDREQTIYWLNAINERLSSTLQNASEQPVLNYEIELLRQSLDQEMRRAEIVRERNIAIYSFIGIVSVMILLFMYNRRKRLQQEVRHYMETINELQLTKPDSSPAPIVKAVDHLYSDRITDLNRLCEIYYEHSDTSRQATKIFEQVRATIESIKSDEARIEELEGVVNSCRNDMMAKLRACCPKLNDRELRVALYSYAGFSSRAICLFMDTNPVALSKVKYRIKSKIKECSSPDAEMLINSIVEH